LINAAAQRAGGNGAATLETLQKEVEALAANKKNIQAAIAAFGDKPVIKQMLAELEEQEREVARQRDSLRRQQARKLELPASATALRQMIEEQFDVLAAESDEFAQLLRKLVPEFFVYLIQLCDGGHLLPRAKIKLALDGIMPDAAHVPGLPELLTREFTIDLFEPPQRERIRAEAVALAASGLGPKAIAAKIAEKPTSTAVQKAIALDRQMREPDENGRWWADLSPVAGPKLGPFTKRSEALHAEVEWLRHHVLGITETKEEVCEKSWVF
jgi:hypothetical protein